MKTKFFSAALIALACLAAPSVSHAKSTLISMTMTQVFPATPGKSTVFQYEIKATRYIQGFLSVKLSAGELPPGAIVSFSPPALRFVGRVPEVRTSIMTVILPEAIDLSKWHFSVTGTALRESLTIWNLVNDDQAPQVPQEPELFFEFGPTGLVLRGVAEPDKTYAIEAAPSLTNPVWTLLGTAMADPTGTFYFQVDPSLPMMFFRSYEIPSDPLTF